MPASWRANQSSSSDWAWIVSLAAFDSADAYDRHLKALAADGRWQAAQAGLMEQAPEMLRLQPTARSLAR